MIEGIIIFALGYVFGKYTNKIINFFKKQLTFGKLCVILLFVDTERCPSGLRSWS